ncbi:MAG TPA: NAD(+)/NADH kinase, partial [Candidatus Limnocylindrales bacterium]|nr:NAD(+)/NADH kinase [Candidatus Limnocylindrales bacterium]
MKAVGFVVHPARSAAVEAAASLSSWLEERSIATSRLDGAVAEDTARATAFARGLDLVVSVGGDGTFLRAAHVASRADVPVLGVKVGRVG